jgi:DNA modification methylase/predicted XRE-type DNA-binding protein
MKIKISKILVRNELYPRLDIDPGKIQEYSENINRLPPIELNQDNVLIDGMHRLKAHLHAGLDEIEYTVFETKDDDDIIMRAVELNATHGLQLCYKDKKNLAVTITQRKLEKDEDSAVIKKKLVNALSIAEDTYNKWTRNIRESFDKQIKEQIIQEYLKAECTQQQVADKFGVDQSRIVAYKNEICAKINLLFHINPKEFFEKLDKNLQNKFLKEYRTKEEIKNSEMPSFEQFYKRLKNNYKELPDFEPKVYNTWSYSKQNVESPVFGTLPQDIIEQLLYYYTEPFDVIYDPFAGAGITVDACKKWHRRYYASDMNPTEIAKAKNIKQRKIQDGIPDDLPKPKLVFLDPPYWKQAKGKYSNSKEDLANMSLQDFENTLTQFFKQLKQWLNAGSYIAIIIGMTQEDGIVNDHAFQIYKILEDLGFKFVQRVMVPYSTQQVNAATVASAQKGKYMLKMYRDLIVVEVEN